MEAFRVGLIGLEPIRQVGLAQALAARGMEPIITTRAADLDGCLLWTGHTDTAGWLEKARINGYSGVVLVFGTDLAEEQSASLLQAGADDVMAGQASVEAICSRLAVRLSARARGCRRIQLRDGHVDLEAGAVCRAGETLSLTTREVALLRYLAERPERVVSREELMIRVWGYSASARSRAVDNTVARLRPKLEQEPHQPAHLRSIYGVGYQLTPATVRPAGSGFVGRGDELADLLGALRGGPDVVLWGLGGIGKTTLMTEAIRQLDVEVTAADLEGVQDPLAALDRVAMALGAAIPRAGGADAAIDAIGAHLAASLQPRLWLDGADHLVVPLADWLADWRRAAPDLQLLISARTRVVLPGAQALHLGVLTEDDAVALLRLCHSGSDEHLPDEAALRRLARHLEYLPLALSLVSRRAHLASLAQLDRQWAAQGPDAATLGSIMARLLTATLTRLSLHAQRLLRRLALFHSPPDLSMAVAMAEADAPDPTALIAELVDHALLTTRPAPGLTDELRLMMLAPIRDHLRTLQPPDGARQRYQELILSRAARFSEHSGRPSPPQGRHILRELEDDLRAIVMGDGPTSPAVRCAALCHMDLPGRGAWLLQAEAVDRLMPLLPQLSPIDQSSVLVRQAAVRFQQGRHDEALQLALRAVERTPPDHPTRRLALNTAAITRLLAGRPEEALALVQRAQPTTADGAVVIADVVLARTTGIIHRRLGQPRQALQHYARGLALADLLEDHDRRGQLRSARAGVLFDLGRMAGAESDFAQAAASEVSSNLPLFEAWARLGQLEARLERGMLPDDGFDLDRIRVLEAQLSSPRFSAHHARVHSMLARSRGDHREALRLGSRAVELSERTGHIEARILAVVALAESWLDLEEFDTARDVLRSLDPSSAATRYRFAHAWRLAVATEAAPRAALLADLRPLAAAVHDPIAALIVDWLCADTEGLPPPTPTRSHKRRRQRTDLARWLGG